MEFTDLTKPFTDEQKQQSFIYLQNYILEKPRKTNHFLSADYLETNQPCVEEY